jgi:hypothetical protein
LNIRDQRTLRLAERANARGLGAAQVFLHVRHGAHAAQDNRDFGLIPEPFERPFRWRAVNGKVLHCRPDLPGRIGQPSAQQWLHNHHRKAFACCQFQAPRPSLILRIHVVILNLAKAPQIAAVHNLFKARIVVMH